MDQDRRTQRHQRLPEPQVEEASTAYQSIRPPGVHGLAVDSEGSTSNPEIHKAAQKAGSPV